MTPSRPRIRPRCVFGEVPEYAMQHRPPGEDEGAPLHDLTANGVYPADVYTHPRYYDTGDADYMAAWDVAARNRGKPEKLISIFRAVPCNVGMTLNNGDWVTTVRRYARDHGRHESDPSKDMCVNHAAVRARCLHTAGDSLFEWGYNCGPKKMFRDFKPRKRSGK